MFMLSQGAIGVPSSVPYLDDVSVRGLVGSSSTGDNGEGTAALQQAEPIHFGGLF